MVSILTSLLFLGLIEIIPLHTAVIKSTVLTTSNTDQHGATIEIQDDYNPDCTIINDLWTINVSEKADNLNQIWPQRGYHLEINLDNTWGFDPNQVSSVRFTILSPTNISSNIPSNDSNYDLDLTVTFSVNNNQFVVPILRLDSAESNKIYPACDTASNPTQLIPKGDVKDCVDRRVCNDANRNSGGDCNRPRSCKSTIGQDNGNHTNMQPPNLNVIPQRLNNFPLTLILTNDPIKDQSFLTLSTQDWNGFKQRCGYGESFDTDAGLQIYLALDDGGEYIQFNEFHIQYLDDTATPTNSPSINPTKSPSTEPTMNPTSNPTIEPSNDPTMEPTLYPTSKPSNNPTLEPTADPSPEPTLIPTQIPSEPPTSQPSLHPSYQPTSYPTSDPSFNPSIEPTAEPTINPTPIPSETPTHEPTLNPSANPSDSPSYSPTANPSIQPSPEPTWYPSVEPTMSPTFEPSDHPSFHPTFVPTVNPSIFPSNTLTERPSIYPTLEPTIEPTFLPTPMPSISPSFNPSISPTGIPTSNPTIQPTSEPTKFPSSQPSTSPTFEPSSFPTTHPTNLPSINPSMIPTLSPTIEPSMQPSPNPTGPPTNFPTWNPTMEPTQNPGPSEIFVTFLCRENEIFLITVQFTYTMSEPTRSQSQLAQTFTESVDDVIIDKLGSCDYLNGEADNDFFNTDVGIVNVREAQHMANINISLCTHCAPTQNEEILNVYVEEQLVPDIIETIQENTADEFPTLQVKEDTAISKVELKPYDFKAPRTTEKPDEPISDPSISEPSAKENFLLVIATALGVILICVIGLSILCIYHLSKERMQTKHTEGETNTVQLNSRSHTYSTYSTYSNAPSARPKKSPLRKESDIQSNTVTSIVTRTLRTETAETVSNNLSTIDVNLGYGNYGNLHSHINTPTLVSSITNMNAYTPGSGGYNSDNEMTLAPDQRVLQWLDEMEPRMARYHAVFIKNGYDTMDIIREITDVTQLKDIGISDEKHQSVIMDEIYNLQEVIVYNDTTDEDETDDEKCETAGNDNMYTPGQDEDVNEHNEHNEQGEVMRDVKEEDEEKESELNLEAVATTGSHDVDEIVLPHQRGDTKDLDIEEDDEQEDEVMQRGDTAHTQDMVIVEEDDGQQDEEVNVMSTEENDEKTEEVEINDEDESDEDMEKLHDWHSTAL